MTTLLITYDGGEGGARLIEAAARLFPSAHATVLHVGGFPRVAQPSTSFDRLCDAATETARLGRELACANGLAAEGMVVLGTGIGDVADAAIQVADEREVDLLLVGGRAPRRLPALAGCIADRLAHRSPRPVLVIPCAEG